MERRVDQPFAELHCEANQVSVGHRSQCGVAGRSTGTSEHSKPSERMTTNDFDSLTVPVLLLDGSLQYPSISADTTAQDLLETLIQLDEVKRTVLDVAPSAWELQRVRREKPGRLWDETELLTLGDGKDSVDIRCVPIFTSRACSRNPGILESTSLIAPLLNKSNSDYADSSLKQFSAFPLTSQPHSPVLQLVARHPLHSLSLSFLRIPEIEDGFEWTVFFGKDATVEDVINNIVQELGLLKVLPSSRGGGRFEYVLEVLSGNQGAQLIDPSGCLNEGDNANFHDKLYNSPSPRS